MYQIHKRKLIGRTIIKSAKKEERKERKKGHSITNTERRKKTSVREVSVVDLSGEISINHPSRVVKPSLVHYELPHQERDEEKKKEKSEVAMAYGGDCRLRQKG